MAEIRTELNWPDEFRDIVTGYPVDAHCSGERCDNTVAYYMNFHDCSAKLVCASHLVRLGDLIEDQLNQFSQVFCTDCDTFFLSLQGLVKVRPV